MWGIWIRGIMAIWIIGIMGIWIMGIMGIWIIGILGILIMGMWIMGIMGIWIMMNHLTLFFTNRGDLKLILLPSLTVYNDKVFLQLWNFTGRASPYHKPPQRGMVSTYICQQDYTQCITHLS